jgi:hypothetical protein
MSSSVFNSQLDTMLYRSTNLLARLNLNIPVNTSKYFRLTDFWATLYYSVNLNAMTNWSCVWYDHLTAPKDGSDRTNITVSISLQCDASVPYLSNVFYLK